MATPEIDVTTTEPIPPGVAAQAAAADKAQQDLISGEGKTDDKKNKGTDTDPVPVHPDPTPAPGKNDEPEKEKAAEQDPPEKSDLEKLQHKFDVLEGKYNAEVPRVNAQLRQTNDLLRQANDTIARQKDEIDRLGNADPAKAEGGKSTPDNLQQLNIDDFEGYGEEMKAAVNLINSLIVNGPAALSTDQIKTLSAKVDRIDSRIVESDEEKFFNQMDAAVSDWETINNNKDFITWLSHPDPASGVLRSTLLENARNSLDSHRCAHFFSTWKESTKQSSAGKKPSNSATGLESQVEPDTSVLSGGDNGSKNPPRVTSADFKKAVNDFQRQRITESEFNEISDAYQKTLSG